MLIKLLKFAKGFAAIEPVDAGKHFHKRALALVKVIVEKSLSNTDSQNNVYTSAFI